MKRWWFGACAAIAVYAVTGADTSHAQTCAVRVGQLVSFDGMVEVQRTGAATWQRPALNAEMCQGDSVRVGKHSRAAIALVNDAVLRLDENTTMRLTQIVREPEKRSIFSLIRGAIQSFSRKPRRLKVNTAYLNGTIEGTEFLLEVRGKRAVLTVIEGDVVADNALGDVTLAAGQSATGEPGKAPVRRIVAKPRDAVQWALHYPPVLAGGGAADSTVERAAALLHVGRVGEARRLIDRAIAANANVGPAYALRAVINVVQNRPDAALADARQAVAASPRSAAAKIALSYAQQSKFDLEAARDTLLQAVKDAPRDALAWARLAELWLSLGYRGRARDAAATATKLAPDLARTQTILGFAALTEFRIGEARAAFTKAIGLSSSDPLPRLGLGLAKINKGDLEGGRREIEIAVGLDSGDALLRSYLGKAYFEEKRAPLDATQLAIAKQLDPLDPTPYLYDALRKQSEGRPGEALKDIEGSIARNDNRAVYRGRLQLDQDRAARGTSAARIYNDLGFRRLGTNEASRSLALDPANASAHRFLSDSFRNAPRRDISRVSELLQAQLMQNVNLNPVQPSLSEASLGIGSFGGAADPGFNEFTSLFQRDSIQLNASGIYGSDDTAGGEAVVTGVYGPVSVSAGTFRFLTDGFRDNFSIEHDIHNFFMQAALTPQLNAQIELRRRITKEGDLDINFDPAIFTDNRRELDQDIMRFGARYSAAPGSDFLLSVIRSGRNERLESTTPDTSGLTTTIVTRATSQDYGTQVEGQHIFKSTYLNVIAGVGFAKVESDVNITLTGVGPPFGPIGFGTVISEPNIRHRRAHAYANINLPQSVTWTLGASYDDYEESGSQHHTRLNPKVGAQWDVNDRFRVRASYLEALKPALMNNRTIEPTQVAGFNQFYDDINATLTRQKAVGFDFRVNDYVRIGGEAINRDMDVPSTLPSGVVISEDEDETLYRTYLYWLLTTRIALNAEVSYDQFLADRGTTTANSSVPEQMDTVTVPVGIRYSDPYGLFAGVDVSYVNQRVTRTAGSGFVGGRDNFFVTDLALGYRLPKRLGVISLEVRNLFDKQFKYQDDSFREFRDEPSVSPFIPERSIVGRVTLNW